MKRRAAMVGGVAAVAAAAGAGVALWRRRLDTPSADADLWNTGFDQPAGGQMTLGAFRGRPLLLNFWATWCPPCVAELPLLDAFQRQQPTGGWQVAGLAVDQLAPVLAFLGQRPVSFPIGLAGAEGIGLARSLGNTGGGLPFTVVFDRAGRPVQRKLGVIAPSDLQGWVRTLT